MVDGPLQHENSGLPGFHRIISRWFAARFNEPTEPQKLGWPKIQAGQDTLIAAPTGSGKTLTAFLVCIDRLLKDGLEGKLKDETRVLYVSPLKALASDIRKNLEMPLLEIESGAEKEGTKIPEIRSLVRTGDTPSHKRQQMLKRPPHILVTTPESLYLLLTGDKSRQILKTVDTVIVDEIHALARDKRGSHLMLSLERLDALCTKKPVRIGLSATQKPIDEIAAFLAGNDTERKPAIIDTGHARKMDLGVEVAKSELSAVCSYEQWEEVYQRIIELVKEHKSTLIFVNTRKLAERVAFHLGQLLGEDQVASHHGSLSKERRLSAEERLKNGELKAIVATASLELGIDIGHIDLVCQIGSPRSIAVFLQRVGRAGHSIGAIPKGRLFALTRDELLEATALIRSVKLGLLDKIEMPEKPLDILAQQIVAEAATRELDEDELFAMMKRAYPYRGLDRTEFDEVVEMLAHGYAAGKRKVAYLHRDAIQRKLKARRGARITAVTSGGAIPEQGDFRVINEDDGSFVGTINEDFALESGKGDVFLLGTTSWMFMGLSGTDVRVKDANGAPPTVPFWLGEAPGRTIELSGEVSSLREELANRITLPTDTSDPLFSQENLEAVRTLDPEPYRAARLWLETELGLGDWPALQAVHYVAVEKAALGLVPTRKQVVFERFFDDTGGMQLVIHAPFGMRINKGWGLALRKRFCRSFDFELQASADNDGIVLSLGPQHSFPIEQLFTMLNEDNIQALLEQAILAVPLFQIRWRWNTTRALAVLRNKNGQRIPPVLQRFRADDLMSAVFPAQTMCKEHVTGDIELPDHPLVRQTMHDCLTEAIDLKGLKQVMRDIASGDIELIARDTREPSPFSYQLLNAYPYAFLDDAPLEERRARAVAQRRTLSFDNLSELTRLDPDVVRQVGREAWPLARDPDELHDTLMAASALPEAVIMNLTPEWAVSMKALIAAGRGAKVQVNDVTLWFAAESLDQIVAAYPGATITPALTLPDRLKKSWEPEDARLALIRGYLETRGVLSEAEIARDLALHDGDVAATLPAIEARGEVVRGKFSQDQIEWCERHLLMRIHKLTLDGLRKQIKPVTPTEFLAFLPRFQRLTTGRRHEGRQGLKDAIDQLAGFDASAGTWEGEILASRVSGYQPQWLDELTHSGMITWGRLSPPVRDEDDGPMTQGMTRVVPLALFPREDAAWLLPPGRQPAVHLLRSNAQVVYEALEKHGAQFYTELRARTSLLESQLEEALGELCRLGLAHADGFAAIRPFVSRNKKKLERQRGLAKRYLPQATYSTGGRWAVFPGPVLPVEPDDRIRRWAMLLLKRYGVVFRDLLTRESAAPSWGELARCYRQLEARGEIRGGRFVAGAYGEQFALPEAIEQLRKAREDALKGDWVIVSAADPLNLVGILTEGPRIPSSRQVLMVLMDGRHVATKDGMDVTFHEVVTGEIEHQIRHALQLSGMFRTRLSPAAARA